MTLQGFESHSDWPVVSAVIAKLQKHGFKTYIAGGAVRDVLIGVKPGDFDIATEATPQDILKLFPNALEIGRAFGIMMLPQENGKNLEIATFRSDGQYTDGRRPDSVKFANPMEDAKRRDFTVNALFYDIQNQEVLDYVGGQKDLDDKVLRAVGDPRKRFQEDHLRILRVFRLACQLNFQIEKNTLQAAFDLSDTVKSVSHERTTQEIKKLLMNSPSLELLETFFQSGVLKSANQEFAEYLEEIFKSHPVFLTEVLKLKNFEALLATVSWWVDQHKDIISEPAWYGKFILSREEKKDSLRLANNILMFFNQKISTYKKILQLDSELGPVLTEIMYALGRHKIKDTKFLDSILELFLKLTQENGELPKAFVTGETLKKMGFRPGAHFGNILEDSYERQLKGEFKTPQDAIQWLEKHGAQNK
jgi:tRNA nucleotidyltransferase/poly(A) polymerase